MQRFVYLTLIITLLGLVLVAPAWADNANLIGKISSIVRDVDLTGNMTATTPLWKVATLHQGVANGYGVRTHKRSQAEITFKDSSILRLNERTDLVIEQTDRLRKVKLQLGAVWVRVAKGANTSVETPTATATAKGTQFVVSVMPDGMTRVTVLEDTVEVTAGGRSVLVNAGQTVSVSAQGVIGTVQQILPADLPVENGGTLTGWWLEMVDGVDISVTPGTSLQQDMRESPINDVVPTTGVAQQAGWYISDTGSRDSFLAVSQNTLIPTFYDDVSADPTLTLHSFAALHGSELINADISGGGTVPIYAYGLTPGDVTFLQSLHINTVSDWVNAIQANGGTFSCDVKGRTVFYKPGSVQMPQSQLRLLDQTDSSLAVLGAGLAAGLLVDRNLTFTTPQLGGLLYGMSGSPSFFGARGGIDGYIGQTHYKVVANALKVNSGPQTDWETRLGSVAYVSHAVGNEGWNIFAGRKTFYWGPVFQNLVNSQLIANRYSGAGIYKECGRFIAEASWLYDSNPDVSGAQSGAMAAVAYRYAGGVYGVNYLNESGIHDGQGATFTFSLPVVRNVVDVYGEVGRGTDEATLQTYGLYFPYLYQKYDVDTFLEYGYHQSVGNSTSLIASKHVSENLEVRAYVNKVNGTTSVGGGAIWWFGKKIE